MAKHHFARLLITLALVTADPLAQILERLDTLERENAEIKAQLKNATQGIQLFADGRARGRSRPENFRVDFRAARELRPGPTLIVKRRRIVIDSRSRQGLYR